MAPSSTISESLIPVDFGGKGVYASYTPALAVSLDLVLKIRKIQKTAKGVDLPLWPNQADRKRPMDRSTGGEWTVEV